MPYKIMWNRRGYTKEEFIKAWNSSISVRQVGVKLGKNLSGSGHRLLKDTAELLGLSNDHMLGQTARSVIPKPKAQVVRDVKRLLHKDSKVQSSHLKKRLWKAGLLEKRCHRCGSEEWFGHSNHLQLDHINGDNKDNRIENLRILCANCHSLTPTWTSKVRN